MSGLRAKTSKQEMHPLEITEGGTSQDIHGKKITKRGSGAHREGRVRAQKENHQARGTSWGLQGTSEDKKKASERGERRRKHSFPYRLSLSSHPGIFIMLYLNTYGIILTF